MELVKYSMSFTTAALLHNESIKLASLYGELGRWDDVRNVVIDGNIIQARTANTLKRFTSEITARLKTLGDHEMKFIVEAHYADQGYMLWLAICRRYAFIADFATDIVHDNFMSFKNSVSYEDYNAFFNNKAQWHSEVDGVAPATKRKLRQTIFQMMREAGLLSKDNNILPIIPTPGFRAVLSAANERDLTFFPIADLAGRAE